MQRLDYDFGLLPQIEPQVLAIRGGQVDCPVHGAIDIEDCFSCEHLRSAADNGQESILCDFSLDRVASIDTAPPAI